jgi:drug/metabolite transporter (DMT)-like permease
MNEACDEACAVAELEVVVTAARGVQLPAGVPAPAAIARFDWPVAAALATTLVLWASAFAGIRYAVREYDAGALALFRNTVTALALLGVALVWKREALRRLSRGDVVRLAVAGVVGIAVYQLALIGGERSVDAGTASLIINTSPIFTALFALAALKEHLGLRGWSGVLLGFAGAALLVTGGHGGAELRAGALFVLVAAVAQSASFVIQKPLLTRLGPFLVTTWVGVFGALAVLPYGPLLASEIGQASWQATTAALYLGLFPAAIGNLSWAYALSRLPAGRASTALYLIAPIALLLSWLLLGEQPGAQALVGGAVVIASVALVNVRSQGRR